VEWIRRNVPAGTPAPRCAFHRMLFVPSFLRNAHVVDTHSCRPGCCPSHIVLFTGRGAQSLLAAESISASPLLRATRSRVGARNDAVFLLTFFRLMNRHISDHVYDGKGILQLR
jgi:hypothetical protein